MKDLIIYGAFDRYNYGDNLMPLLFELYLNRSYSHLLDEYHIKFAAINKSDLSRYGVSVRQFHLALSRLPW